jgi:hypothetical protein
MVRVFSERHGILSLDAKTGEVQKTGAKIWWPTSWTRGGAAQLNSLFVANKDWTNVVSYYSGGRFLRRYETETGKLLFENRLLSVNGIAALPDSQFIVTLAQRSGPVRGVAVLAPGHGVADQVDAAAWEYAGRVEACGASEERGRGGREWQQAAGLELPEFKTGDDFRGEPAEF